MQKQSEYNKELFKKTQLKRQIIAVASIIIITLSSGTAFGAIILNDNSKTSQSMRIKVNDFINEDKNEPKCTMICKECSQVHKLDYIPDNLDRYHCIECENDLIIVDTND